SALRARHSFPTRRSSDLNGGGSPRRSRGRVGAYSAATRAGCWFRTAFASFATTVPSKKRGLTPPHSRTAFSKVKSRKSSFVMKRSEEHTSELQSLTHLVC